MPFLRFVTHDIDPESQAELGIFQATYKLWRAGELTAAEEAWWADIRAFLNIELDAPPRFTRSRRAGAPRVALSWFKDSATAHIAKAREVVSLLELRDIPTRTLTTEKPGYVVYEDDHQIVAEPFR